MTHGKFRTAICLKNEAVNQLKAKFIYWKAIRVSPVDYTHRLAVCAHFERDLPPSLWPMVLQTSEVFIISICDNCSKGKLFQRELLI